MSEAIRIMHTYSSTTSKIKRGKKSPKKAANGRRKEKNGHFLSVFPAVVAAVVAYVYVCCCFFLKESRENFCLTFQLYFFL